MQGKDKKISHEGEYRASGLVHRDGGGSRLPPVTTFL